MEKRNNEIMERNITNQTKLTNILMRKDFLGELKVNEDLMKKYLEEDPEEIPVILETKGNHLDRDEVILSFDDFVNRRNH